jgi:hypothetical protein
MWSIFALCPYIDSTIRLNFEGAAGCGKTVEGF